MKYDIKIKNSREMYWNEISFINQRSMNFVCWKYAREKDIIYINGWPVNKTKTSYKRKILNYLNEIYHEIGDC